MPYYMKKENFFEKFLSAETRLNSSAFVFIILKKEKKLKNFKKSACIIKKTVVR